VIAWVTTTTANASASESEAALWAIALADITVSLLEPMALWSVGERISNGQATAPPFANVVAVAAGTWHSLHCWPMGTFTAGVMTVRARPMFRLTLAMWMAIAAGGNHSLALRADGTVVAWGENINSQGFYAWPNRLCRRTSANLPLLAPGIT